jgi:hypothetical protein
MTQHPRLRVVQWATGNIGTRSLRHLIEHPDLELVGVVVHDPAKVGQDAGVLAGLAPNGVAATDRLADVLALRPDCVMYMPRHPGRRRPVRTAGRRQQRCHDDRCRGALGEHGSDRARTNRICLPSGRHIDPRHR